MAPKRLPIVKSGAPTRVTALIPVKSSGREVTAARRTSPIHNPPRPVLRAIMSPYLATLLPEKKMIKTHKINFTQTKVSPFAKATLLALAGNVNIGCKNRGLFVSHANLTITHFKEVQ